MPYPTLTYHTLCRLRDDLSDRIDVLVREREELEREIRWREEHDAVLRAEATIREEIRR